MNLPDKRKEWKTVRDKLDRVFSEFVRRRDSGKTCFTGCITCGRFFPWQDMDCGHFIGRQHYGVRWDERNGNAQCRHCNRFEEGRKDLYAPAIQKKYGKGVLEDLEIKKKLNSKKPTVLQMRGLIEVFKERGLIEVFKEKIKEMT